VEYIPEEQGRWSTFLKNGKVRYFPEGQGKVEYFSLIRTYQAENE